MRSRFAASVLVASVTALSACTRAAFPSASPTAEPAFSIHQLPPSPSPLALEVQSGQVQGLIPSGWRAEPLPPARFPQQGFVASPELEDWEGGAGAIRGMEAFWVDVTSLHISSDYYYVVAKGPALASLAGNENCHPTNREVLADHPPELSGLEFSPGDYVVTARGTCHGREGPTKWAYIVAAPGFGPVRQVGLPSSGLYVVLAVVSGKRAGAMLEDMIDGARFANVSITQIVAAARTTT
jgi:hypothetical protein